ncbi:MAG: prepilin-type N-terminal cleavage/methylation domain-containing protein [Gammaproteobacteria bacterium]|nr:prepilin-type N-terminal cleavage/methylation domain-containing protein [Gammaproteobacteria bacterium]
MKSSPPTRFSNYKFSIQAGGFSLIEFIIVIVILAILSVAITTIFTDTTVGYLQSENRIKMSSSARIAIEKISREVRTSMPGSVRVNSANTCVEFVPIEVATSYSEIPTTSPDTQITVVERDAATNISGLSTSNLYTMIIPLNSSEVYNTSTGHFAVVGGFTKLGSNLTQVTINSTRFSRTSPQQRIFFVRQPVSYCIVGNRLNRYSDYGFNVSQPDTSSMGTADLVLTDISNSDGSGTTTNLFSYDTGALNRGGILLIEFFLQGRDETVKLEHEVHVRNFP